MKPGSFRIDSINHPSLSSLSEDSTRSKLQNFYICAYEMIDEKISKIVVSEEGISFYENHHDLEPLESVSHRENEEFKKVNLDAEFISRRIYRPAVLFGRFYNKNFYVYSYFSVNLFTGHEHKNEVLGVSNLFVAPLLYKGAFDWNGISAAATRSALKENGDSYGCIVWSNPPVFDDEYGSWLVFNLLSSELGSWSNTELSNSLKNEIENIIAIRISEETSSEKILKASKVDHIDDIDKPTLITIKKGIIKKVSDSCDRDIRLACSGEGVDTDSIAREYKKVIKTRTIDELKSKLASVIAYRGGWD